MILNMRLKKIKLNNFRCYKGETEICLDDLTVFIGKNDSGKSSIFDTLEIFFNEPKNCPDKDDLNVYADDEIISITCIFEDLPEQIIIDATYPTTLQNEYMLNSEGYLEVKKLFSVGTRINSKVYAVALHPNNQNYNDLLSINQTGSSYFLEIMSSNLSPYLSYASLYLIFLNGLLGILSFRSNIFNSLSHSLLID